MAFPNTSHQFNEQNISESGSFVKCCKLLVQTAEKILERYHSIILLSLGIVFLGVEIVEHLRSGNQNQSHFITEVSLVFILLTTAYILIRLLLDSLEKRNQAIQTLHMKYNMGTVLSSSQDIADLTTRLIQQVGIIVPQAMTDLYLHEKRKGIYKCSRVDRAQEEMDAGTNHGAALKLDEGPCRMCLIHQNGKIHPMHSCRQSAYLNMDQRENSFCLPLVQGTTSVGLLFLNLPAQTNLKSEQIFLLENTSYEMASSLSLLIEKKGNEEAVFAQKVNQLQLEIARDLHDTIGQNIGYLRMHLDHMAEKEQQNCQEASVELNQLVDVANESYDLMRGTLAVLQSVGSDDILPLFTHYAEKVMERTGLTITIHNRGDAGCLHSNSMRQLYFIFREALSNIEKHAQATQVKVELIWNEDHLQLVITDNGVGFTTDGIAKGRYGIKFMRGRVDSLQGSLSIQTAPGVGTILSIQAPCDC